MYFRKKHQTLLWSFVFSVTCQLEMDKAEEIIAITGYGCSLIIYSVIYGTHISPLQLTSADFFEPYKSYKDI
jgi:hypothetical protein